MRMNEQSDVNRKWQPDWNWKLPTSTRNKAAKALIGQLNAVDSLILIIKSLHEFENAGGKLPENTVHDLLKVSKELLNTSKDFRNLSDRTQRLEGDDRG